MSSLTITVICLSQYSGVSTDRANRGIFILLDLDYFTWTRELTVDWLCLLSSSHRFIP